MKVIGSGEVKGGSTELKLKIIITPKGGSKKGFEG